MSRTQLYGSNVKKVTENLYAKIKCPIFVISK